MASEESMRNLDPFPTEGGGPAHNTTLDVHYGRLPGADQTSNLGQRLRGPDEQLPEGGPRNHETEQETGDQLWVAGVLDRALTVRLRMGVLHTLTTLDKTVAECLAALGFSDSSNFSRESTRYPSNKWFYQTAFRTSVS